MEVGHAGVYRSVRASTVSVFAAASFILPIALGPQPALATFPGANGRIVFVRDNDLYTMRPDGSHVRQVTRTPNRIEYLPAWSPDGSKIAFVKNSPPWKWNVFTINADGTGLTRITHMSAWDPAWSPSGRRIAFDRPTKSGTFEVWVKRLGGEVRQLTYHLGGGEPDWSAPGMIAFIGAGPNDPLPEVYTIRPDGTGLLQLTDNDVREGNPDASPDGTLVAWEGYNADTSSWDIYSVASTGGPPVDISDAPDAGDTDPAWSPDGSMIVFHSIRDFRNDVYLMSADGTGQALIDNGADGDQYPDWQSVNP